MTEPMTTLKLIGADIGLVNLNDGINTFLRPGWRPRAAPRRMSRMGGRSPFMDADESIPIRISGQSVDEVLNVQNRLAAAIDQSWRWKEGGGVSAVILNYLPVKSALGYNLQAAVWGTPDGASDILDLPVTFNKFIGAYEIEEVRIPIRRTGYWLGDEEEITVDTGVSYPVVMSNTFSESLFIPWPVDVSVYMPFLSTPSDPLSPTVLITNDADKLLYIEGEDANGGSDGTAVVTAANSPRGGAYWQMTAAVGVQNVEFTLDVSLKAVFNYCHVFACIRNNNASSWYITPKLKKYVLGTYTAGARRITIDESTTDPRIVYLGVVRFDGSVSAVSLDVESEATATDTLDIDYLCLLRDDDQAYTLYVPELIPFASRVDTRITHRSLTHPYPQVGTFNAVDDTLQDPLPWEGNAHVNLLGNEIAVTLMATSGASFRPAATNYFLTATRRPSYLTPR